MQFQALRATTPFDGGIHETAQAVSQRSSLNAGEPEVTSDAISESGRLRRFLDIAFP
jgi:hypothetical protein